MKSILLKPVLFNILPFLSFKNQIDVYVGSILPKDLILVIRFLRDSSLYQYKILTAISVVDYPERLNRFEVVYELLSILNHRFTLKTFVSENSSLPSIVNLYPCANWWEREAWDLFGVFFNGHPDLRRLLSDYGFEGHPLRKDFPLSGYIDLRYDESVKKVVIEAFIQDQSFRVFNYLI